MKHVLAMLLCLAIAVGFAFAGGASESTGSSDAAVVNPTGYPIVKSPITLHAFTFIAGQQQDFNNMEVTAKLEKMTGMKIDWTSPQQKDASEKLNLLFASGSYPDFVFRMHPSNFLQYATDGVVIKLGDLAAKYAPNYEKLLKESPAAAAASRAYDGAMYGFVSENDSPNFKVIRFPFVNTKWLAKVGMDIPKTSDDLLAVLRAFKKAGDIDGDGVADDQWPLAAHSEGLLMNGLGGMFGLKRATDPVGAFSIPNSRGNQMWNTYDNGKFSFMIFSPEYRNLLKYAYELYKEGLIEPDIISHDDKTYFGRLADGKYGLVWQLNPVAFKDYQKDFTYFNPMKGPTGIDTWTMVTNGGIARDHWFLTKADKYPAATVRWIDFFYSEQGSEDAWFVDVPKYFEKSGDTFKPTKLLLNEPEGVQNFLGKNTYQAGSGYVGWDRAPVVLATYLDNPIAEFSKKIAPFLAPPTLMVSMSADEQRQGAAILSEAFVTFQKYQAQFIAGALDPGNDADWNKYVNAMKAYDLATVEKILTTALNRQTGKS